MYLLVFFKTYQSVERVHDRNGNFLLKDGGKIRRTKNSKWISGYEYTRPDSCASDSKLVHDEREETPFFLLEEQI